MTRDATRGVATAALAQLDHARPDAGIEPVARDLIAEEPDTSSRRKQGSAWTKARARTT